MNIAQSATASTTPSVRVELPPELIEAAREAADKAWWDSQLFGVLVGAMLGGFLPLAISRWFEWSKEVLTRRDEMSRDLLPKLLGDYQGMDDKALVTLSDRVFWTAHSAGRVERRRIVGLHAARNEFVERRSIRTDAQAAFASNNPAKLERVMFSAEYHDRGDEASVREADEAFRRAIRAYSIEVAERRYMTRRIAWWWVHRWTAKPVGANPRGATPMRQDSPNNQEP